ncbi:RidA family protein [Desulfitibacter alkalitolerans]|uniref:RidA family protein n=1 Tax=Desulfitibacter alkalitolerans TaxID=264641 RepID=UPI00048808EF|nr:RidA family protein [Desulfitibacter alkalitolerans]
MLEEKIKSLGLTIPEPPEPVAAYVPAVKAGSMIYTSGQIPIVDGILKYKGKIGLNLTEEEGYQAAKVCCINCLSVIKGEVDSLDEIEKIVKVTGYVNSAPGFTGQSKVINGVSDLLGEIFAESGEHARAAIGVCELPIDAAVEVEMLVKLKD